MTRIIYVWLYICWYVCIQAWNICVDNKNHTYTRQISVLCFSIFLLYVLSIALRQFTPSLKKWDSHSSFPMFFCSFAFNILLKLFILLTPLHYIASFLLEWNKPYIRSVPAQRDYQAYYFSLFFKKLVVNFTTDFSWSFALMQAGLMFYQSKAFN